MGGGGGQSADRTLIQNKGSDTLVNVAQAWAEAYQSVNPSVVVAVSGGGSGTGIAALINGTVDIANSSRAIKAKELKLAEDNGQDPLQHVVGYDALAVFLHADNPLEEISIEQLVGIYGEGGEVTRWTDLGVEVPGCQGQEIVVVMGVGFVGAVMAASARATAAPMKPRKSTPRKSAAKPYMVNGLTAQLMNRVKNTGLPLLPALMTSPKSIFTIIGYIMKNRQTAMGMETTGAPFTVIAMPSSVWAAPGAILPSRIPPMMHSSTQTER